MAGIRSVLPEIPVIVVENGSNDQTASVARGLGATVCSTPIGYARALKAGFSLALQHTPPWVAQLDADGQHPPEALPALIAALSEADLVIGSRFHGPSGYAIPLLRKRGIQLLGRLASACAGVELRDVTSGMRVWHPLALQKMLPDFPEEIADANLLVRACRRGIRIRELSVPMRPRLSGRSMHASPASVLFAARMAWLCLQE